MRCDLTFSETEDSFGVTIRGSSMSNQQPEVERWVAYENENEFFKRLMAADLSVESTRRVITAAFHTIAGSAASERSAVVDLTQKQIDILALRSKEQRLWLV